MQYGGWPRLGGVGQDEADRRRDFSQVRVWLLLLSAWSKYLLSASFKIFALRLVFKFCTQLGETPIWTAALTEPSGEQGGVGSAKKVQVLKEKILF